MFSITCCTYYKIAETQVILLDNGVVNLIGLPEVECVSGE